MGLLFLDESEIHLHPHLVKMWMPKGETVEVPAPGKNRKLVVYGALNFEFGTVDNLRDGVAEVLDELNRPDDHELTLSFRDPLSRDFLQAA